MIELLLSRLQKARPAGNKSFTACCPSHEDKSPSLSITERNGRVLVHCHAGCSPNEIITAAGLTWEDMFEDEWDVSYQRAVSMKKTLEPVNPLRVDENVLLIVREKIKNGETLTAEDEARATLAYERVKEAYNA